MLALIELIAAFNGALVGAVLLAQTRAPLTPRLTLAAFLILVSAQLALFVALDSAWIRYSIALGVALDVAALLTAALVLHYVRASVSQRPLGYAPYAPALLYLVACLVNGGRFGAPGDMSFIVAIQMLYSAAAAYVYFGARAKLPPGWAKRLENRHLPLLLAGLALLHIGQVLRLVAPDSSLTFELAPLIGATGLITFTIYAMMGSQSLRNLAASRRPALAEDELGKRLDALMRESRPFIDPDLTLAKTAGLLSVPGARLSAYLNSTRGLSFRAYINELRIEEAKRLLRAPSEARSSIDAIAQLVGFRSRSSFYTAFQNLVGMTPQDYRISEKTSP